MERLTNHFDYCKMIDCKFYDAELYKQGKCKFFDKSIEHCHEKRMNDKLREYEDAEEQGLLTMNPCKTGEQVYCIEEYEDGCDYSCYLFIAVCNDYVIVSPRYMSHDDFEEQLVEMCEESQEWMKVSFVMFPLNKVFLTKEEAEKALERMNNHVQF